MSQELKQAEQIQVVHQLKKHFKPFVVLQVNEDYFIMLGNQRVSERRFDNVEQAEKYLASKPYEIIFNSICATFELMKDYETTKRKD